MPRTLEGREAQSPDEVALGRVEARTLGVGVGDDVTFTGSAGDETYRVVGLVVVPSVGGSDGVGEGAVMTAEGLLRVEPEPDAVNAAVEVREGLPRRAAVKIAQSIGAYAGDGETVGESLPSSIINLDRIVSVPVVLAGVFALLAVVTLLHGLVVSFNARRTDLAVLRALGADGSWVSRSVHWQATILAAVPFALGVPFGLAFGAALFRAVIDRVGAVPDPSLPFLVLLITGVGLVLLANVVALVPVLRARQIKAVDHLRPE
jgi:ABC-type lipoprotein release transport system permease subunit